MGSNRIPFKKLDDGDLPQLIVNGDDSQSSSDKPRNRYVSRFTDPTVLAANAEKNHIRQEQSEIRRAARDAEARLEDEKMNTCCGLKFI